MVRKYVSVILKFCGLGLVIGAGSLWAGATTRPKNRDEQTLIGGSIWSQTIIPIGLLISMIADEELNVFVHAYFLLAGVLLLITAGAFLIVGEFKSYTEARTRQEHASTSIVRITTPVLAPFDKIYFGIGLLSLLAGVFTVADFIVTIS